MGKDDSEAAVLGIKCDTNVKPAVRQVVVRSYEAHVINVICRINPVL